MQEEQRFLEIKTFPLKSEMKNVFQKPKYLLQGQKWKSFFKNQNVSNKNRDEKRFSRMNVFSSKFLSELLK